MRIQSIASQPQRINNTPKNQPSFSGFEKLTQKMPQMGGVSYAELLNIYSLSKKFRLGLTTRDVEILDKFKGMDFVKKAFEYLCNKFWIPEKIKPTIIPHDIMQNVEAAYMPVANIIFVRPGYVASRSNKEIFGALRHEFEHYIQTISVFQHETYGPKYIDYLVNTTMNMIKNRMMQILEHPNDEILREIYRNPNDRMLFMQVKMAHYNKDTEKINQIFEKEGEKYKAQLDIFRKQIIERFGLVEKDSPRTEMVKKYYHGFKNSRYIESDGTVNNSVYLGTFTEREALQAQSRAIFEYSKEPCFIKFMKDNMQTLFG